MPIVRFSWDPQLVDLRREVCARARWDKTRRAWVMTDTDVEVFLAAVQARMHVCRMQCTVSVDSAVWILGFVQGAPYRQSVATGVSGSYGTAPD